MIILSFVEVSRQGAVLFNNNNRYLGHLFGSVDVIVIAITIGTGSGVRQAGGMMSHLMSHQ